MGCYLGWYSTVGCPLRGEEENKYIKGASGPPKTIKEKKQYMETIMFVKGTPYQTIFL
jgi:hypothetical protein